MRSEAKRILLIRTFKMLKGGGPVPPLGLLYLAAVVRERFGSQYELKILDTGLMTEEEALEQVREYQPHIVGLSVMSCEEDLMHAYARAAKEGESPAVVLVGGPHSMVLKQDLLQDENIDYVVVGEGEETITELLEALDQGGDPGQIPGLACRQGEALVLTDPRPPIQDLDALPFPAWDLVDMREYGRHPNWNGTLKRRFYATIATSRGCPYGCYFCHNVFGKRVRMRSAESVVEELSHLREQYGVREVHVLDDIFNFQVERAEEICRGIIAARLKLALAFPNGLRADILTKELITLLRQAGTYKVNFGIETTSPRLQQMIGKRLNLDKAEEMINATGRTGIITGAYFMLGFPSQTREEMMETICYAEESTLDVAYFFKATPYPGSRFYDSLRAEDSAGSPGKFSDLHFYSVERSYCDLDAGQLNELLLLAQRRFFLKSRRVWTGLRKAPRKLTYIKTLFIVLAMLLQAFIFKILVDAAAKEKRKG